jgi:hypothetical protein
MIYFSCTKPIASPEIIFDPDWSALVIAGQRGSLFGDVPVPNG